MLFSSITFLYFFLPATLGLYYLAPVRLKNHVLLLASLVFYASGEPRYVLLLLLSALVGWLHGLGFRKRPHHRGILASGLCWNLAFLLFFKYADFLIGSVNGLLGTAIAFDGPPVGAYGLCMGWEPRVLLGTLGVFFVLRATVTLVLQGMAGFYTPTVLTCAMYGAPGVILGTCIAFPVVKHISQQAFRKVLLCVIAVAGLVCLVRALG